MPFSVNQRVYIPNKWLLDNGYSRLYLNEYSLNDYVSVVVLKQCDSWWYEVEMPSGETIKVSSKKATATAPSSPAPAA